jgi:hypothetical protein
VSEPSALDDVELVMQRLLRARRSLLGNEEAKKFAERAVAGNARVSAIEQLEIYRRQFWLRHTESLVEDFPGVGRIVGQAQWERLVEDYLDAHPPRSTTLRDVGQHLASFAASRDWLACPELVADMAALEWALIEAFDASAHPPLDPRALAAVPEHAWATARFAPHPTLRLLALRYPVPALLTDAVAAARRGEPALEPLSPIEPRATFIAVYRKDLVVHRVELEAVDHALLSRLIRGEPLEKACEEAARELSLGLDVLSERLMGLFRDWASRGYFVKVSTSS